MYFISRYHIYHTVYVIRIIYIYIYYIPVADTAHVLSFAYVPAPNHYTYIYIYHYIKCSHLKCINMIYVLIIPIIGVSPIRPGNLLVKPPIIYIYIYMIKHMKNMKLFMFYT